MQCVQYLSFADENVYGRVKNPHSNDDDGDGKGDGYSPPSCTLYRNKDENLYAAP